MRVVAAAVALVACAGVPAAATGPRSLGPKKTTITREVVAFEAIRLDAPLDVTVKVGPERSVKVTADADLQEEVRTRIVDATLVVDLAPGHRPGRRLAGTRVDVTVPALRRFELGGSGDATIDGGGAGGELALSVGGSGELRWRGEAAVLEAAVAGSGKVQLAGRARRLSVAVDGSGGVRARELAATDVEVRVAGTGDVEVTVAGGALRAEVSGSGDVSWWGNGKLERAEVAGTGRILHR